MYKHHEKDAYDREFGSVVSGIHQVVGMGRDLS